MSWSKCNTKHKIEPQFSEKLQICLWIFQKMKIGIKKNIVLKLAEAIKSTKNTPSDTVDDKKNNN